MGIPGNTYWGVNNDYDYDRPQHDVKQPAQDEFILDGSTPCPECKFTEKHLASCKYHRSSPC